MPLFPQKVWLQGKQLRPLASLIRIRLKAESLNLVNKLKHIHLMRKFIPTDPVFVFVHA